MIRLCFFITFIFSACSLSFSGDVDTPTSAYLAARWKVVDVSCDIEDLTEYFEKYYVEFQSNGMYNLFTKNQSGDWVLETGEYDVLDEQEYVALSNSEIMEQHIFSENTFTFYQKNYVNGEKKRLFFQLEK